MSPRSGLDFLKRFEDPEQEKSVEGKAVIRPETAALEGLEQGPQPADQLTLNLTGDRRNG